MFKQTLLSKARRNRVLIDYAGYQDKKTNKKRWSFCTSFIRLLSLCLLVALTVFFVLPLNAETYNNYSTLDNVSSGQLLFESSEKLNTNTKQKKLFRNAVQLNSDASFEVNGILATVTVTQSFLNTGNDITQGLYTFPLPEKSAVNYLKIQIGNREIVGKIVEKNIATKLFNQARAKGKKASLVEQYRPNLFTNKIANIAAKEQITVTLKYIQHVDYDNGEFSLRFPMHITPRYSSKMNNFSFESTHQRNNESQSSRTISRLAEIKTPIKNNISLRVNLNSGLPLQTVSSPSHSIKFNHLSLKEGPISISVGNVQVPMDKDFILKWRPTRSKTPQLSIINQSIDGEEYSLIMLLPHSKDIPSKRANIHKSFARDITFIIDTSGSMQGKSIKQAKKSLRFAVNSLSSQDSFNIISFASHSKNLFKQTKMANTENISTAINFIDQLSANGGTEMYQPLSDALNMQQTQNQYDQAIKQILFITDGAVSNELSLFKLIKNTTNLPRLFTVGIGSAPNGYFMRKAAQFGQGSYTFIGNVNEVEKQMSVLLNKINQPALTNLAIRFQPLHLGKLEQYPTKIPDLYQDEPLTIAIKTSNKPKNIQIFGDGVNERWQKKIDLSEKNIKKENGDIASIWARSKIEDLLGSLVLGNNPETVKNKVIKTSLKHQVLSPYTSFIAIEKEVIDDIKFQENETNDLKLKKQLNQSKQINQTKTTIQQLANNNLQAVTFPKTATGWKVQLILGLILLTLSLITLSNKRKNHVNN